MKYAHITGLLLSVVISAYGEDKWIRLRTPNFEVITPQSEKKAKETALYFEQLREFFLSYWHASAEPGNRVRIVLFGNEKQYEPFRPHQFASGYFQHGIDRDWIVLGGSQDQSERLICHEYTHLMVRQVGLNLPIWLNEGLAEVYSTFKPVGGKVQIGDLIAGHFHAVDEGWIPVARLVEVKHSDQEYNGKGAHQFYAGAWGLTHMLMLSQESRDLYSGVIEQLIAGKSLDQAIAAKGLTLQRLDGDLRVYLKRNDRFYAGLIGFKSQKSTAEWKAERVGQAELDATLALLQMNIASKANEAKARLSKVDEGSWYGQEVMAYSKWRSDGPKAAAEHFVKAIELGATNAKLYLDAAKVAMYSGSRNPDSAKYLRKAIELHPEWTDAKLQLLEQLIFLRMYEEAEPIAAAFKKISPKEASRLFRNLGYLEAMTKGVAAGEVAYQRAKESAKSDYDKAECERLEGFLNQMKSAQLAAAAQGEALATYLKEMREKADREEGEIYGDGIRLTREEPPPTIRRAKPGRNGETEVLVAEKSKAAEEGSLSVYKPVNSNDLTGTLVNIVCGGAAPVLHVINDQGEQVEIELKDPKNVNLQMLSKGQQAQELELNCGEQRRKVKVSYLPQAGGGPHELRAIQYLP